MALTKIDKYRGPIKGLIKLLERLILDMRRSQKYAAALDLCAGTRSAFLHVRSWCQIFPVQSVEDLEGIEVALKTAVFELRELRAELQISDIEGKHLDGMISNITYRVKMVLALRDTSRPMRERLAKVNSLSDRMVRAQRYLRSVQDAPISKSR